MEPAHNVPQKAWKKSNHSRARQMLRSLTLDLLGTLKRDTGGSFLRGLYCHHVSEEQKKDFKLLLKSLQGIGKFVSTDRFLDMLHGRQPLDGKYFHLSFDDGLKNIYQNAAPVLAELDIPAIIFAPSHIVEADRATLEHYCMETINLGKVLELSTWSELREMAEAGIELGSHTKTHACLADIEDEDTLRSEIFDSKNKIEDAMGRECKYISWPYGALSHVSKRALALVEEAGYEACFGAFRGSVLPGKTSRFCIPRHHFGADWPWRHVRYFALGSMEIKSDCSALAR